MPVQTIECHIATVLMKRFLDGDDLPQELLHDLEKHVKACSSCRDLLNNEKLSMEEVLDGKQESKSGISGLIGKFGMKPATAGGFATAYPTEALVGAARTSYQSQAPGMAAFKNPKVLFLSGALALVVIAMSTILRDPTVLLGAKADAGLSAGSGQEDPEGAAGSTDDHGSDSEHGSEGEDDGHGSDGHEDEGHGDETLTDGHGEADDHAADGHGEEASATDGHGEKGDDDHGADSHESDGHATKKDDHGEAATGHANRDLNQTSRPGTVVPGEKTIADNNVVIIGGDEPKKESSAPKKSTTSHSSPPKKSSSSSAKRTTSSSSSKKKSSGIKVYDQNGKPIR